MTKKSKILLFDIETAPIVGYTWGLWEQNVIDTKEEWYMLTFSYKWLGEKTTHVLSLPDLPTYKLDPKNDCELVAKLWELFDEADVVIAHNGDAFDIKKANIRFIKHGFTPPTPYKSIDTKKVAKSVFKFDSNKLDNLGKFLGLGEKLETGGGLSCGSDVWQETRNLGKRCVIITSKMLFFLRRFI